MKIALLTPGFSQDESDWCIPFIYNLVRGLAERHDVHVFTLRYPTRRGDYPFFGATVHAMGGHYRLSGLRRLPLWNRALRAITREHERGAFDAIHGLWADEPGALARWAGVRLGRPSVVTLVGGELANVPEIGYGLQRGRVSRWLVAQGLRADRVIAPCHWLADKARGRVDGARLRISPFGTDTARFSPAVAPDGRPHAPALRLIAVGSLVPVKGHRGLLDAFACLRTPGVHLDIVGDGTLRGELTQHAAHLGIADRVTFHGAVAHDQLPALVRRADLHVLTSFHEGFGLVVTEAAACGVPTIGTGVGVLPELAAQGAGVLLDARTSAAQIDDLLNDAAGRALIRDRTLKIVRERYSLAAMVDGVERVYAE